MFRLRLLLSTKISPFLFELKNIQWVSWLSVLTLGLRSRRRPRLRSTGKGVLGFGYSRFLPLSLNLVAATSGSSQGHGQSLQVVHVAKLSQGLDICGFPKTSTEVPTVLAVEIASWTRLKTSGFFTVFTLGYLTVFSPLIFMCLHRVQLQVSHRRRDNAKRGLRQKEVGFGRSLDKQNKPSTA